METQIHISWLILGIVVSFVSGGILAILSTPGDICRFNTNKTIAYIAGKTYKIEEIK